MKVEELITIVDPFLTNAFANPTTKKAFYGNGIPEKKLLNARINYAYYNEENERPLLFFDDTMFGSGKLGFLITNENFYYRLTEKFGGQKIEGVIPISKIDIFECVRQRAGYYIYINDVEFAYLCTLQEDDVLSAAIFFGMLYKHKYDNDSVVLEEVEKNDRDLKSNSSQLDNLESLKQIKELYELGILTEEEYENKKKEILTRI